MKAKPKLVVIVGPTASGKTALGIALAAKIGGAVVSADSRQIYTDLNIGTGKPDQIWSGAIHPAIVSENISGVEHYLFNIGSPNKPVALLTWQAGAYSAINKIIAQGRTPFLVGGTMQYIESIVQNWQIPAVDADPYFRAWHEKMAAPELFAKLIKLDPAAANFIEPHNKRRIIRALEVIAATGQPFSATRKQEAPPFDVLMLGLNPSREQLQINISQRAQGMFDQGLLEETKKLRTTYAQELLQQTTNYRQALQVLDAKMTIDEALADMLRSDLRYARRQMSWWRNRPEINWLDENALTAAQLLI